MARGTTYSTSAVQSQPAKLLLDSTVTTGISRCQGGGSPFGKLWDCFAEQGLGRPCSQPRPGHGCDHHLVFPNTDPAPGFNPAPRFPLRELSSTY